MGQPLADCDFNLAALHPAYPIKRRTSAERTQASPERRHPEEFAALDPLENNIRKYRSFPDDGPNGRVRTIPAIAAIGLWPCVGGKSIADQVFVLFAWWGGIREARWSRPASSPRS